MVLPLLSRPTGAEAGRLARLGGGAGGPASPTRVRARRGARAARRQPATCRDP
jgi:hypothetical protein